MQQVGVEVRGGGGGGRGQFDGGQYCSYVAQTAPWFDCRRRVKCFVFQFIFERDTELRVHRIATLELPPPVLSGWAWASLSKDGSSRITRTHYIYGLSVLRTTRRRGVLDLELFRFRCDWRGFADNLVSDSILNTGRYSKHVDLTVVHRSL